MSTLTAEYKKSDEYKSFRQHILEECPGMNEYLVDMIISIHLAKPLLYRDKKIIRKDLLNTEKRPRVLPSETIEGSVHIEQPTIEAQ